MKMGGREGHLYMCYLYLYIYNRKNNFFELSNVLVVILLVYF